MTKKIIAVVDDDEDMIMFLQFILENQYDIRTYSKVKDALSDFMITPPDLILLDISMPDMDGVTALNEIRKTPVLLHLPVIAVTAYGMRTDRDKYLNLGFTEYISKPIESTDYILKLIEKTIR